MKVIDWKSQLSGEHLFVGYVAGEPYFTIREVSHPYCAPGFRLAWFDPSKHEDDEFSFSHEDISRVKKIAENIIFAKMMVSHSWVNDEDEIDIYQIIPR